MRKIPHALRILIAVMHDVIFVAAQGALHAQLRPGEVVVAAAQLVLADQNRFTLSEEKMDRFLASLEEEPKVLPKLRELFARKSVFE